MSGRSEPAALPPIAVKIVISGGFGVGKTTFVGAVSQDRFAFLWDDLVDGALGAIVLLDTRRVQDCFASVDYFEEHDIPFLVGVNTFDRARRFDLAEVRDALGVDRRVPIVECDARRRESVEGVLMALTEEVLTRRLSREHAGSAW